MTVRTKKRRERSRVSNQKKKEAMVMIEEMGSKVLQLKLPKKLTKKVEVSKDRGPGEQLHRYCVIPVRFHSQLNIIVCRRVNKKYFSLSLSRKL